MTTHSSILAWRIPWTEEPGRLQSMDGITESDTTELLTHTHTHTHTLQHLKVRNFHIKVQISGFPGIIRSLNTVPAFPHGMGAKRLSRL